MTGLAIIFWLSTCVVFYAWGVYPLAVWWIGHRHTGGAGSARVKSELPHVSLVMTTPLNRADAQDWLDSCRRLKYPSDHLEFVVASEHESLDGVLVTALGGPPVKTFDISHAEASPAKLTGDIVVFTVGATSLEPGAIQRLGVHFQDPGVKCVTGRLIGADSTTGRHDDPPWRAFDVWLQRWETKCGLPPRVEPAICAVRPSLFATLESSGFRRQAFDRLAVDDCQGRTICDPSMLALEKSTDRSSRLSAKLRQSFRTASDLLRTALHQRTPEQTKAFVAQFHRTLRLATPALLMLAMGSNVLLSHQPLYMRILLLHEALYVLAAIAWWRYQKGRDVGLYVDMRPHSLDHMYGRDVSAVSG